VRACIPVGSFSRGNLRPPSRQGRVKIGASYIDLGAFNLAVAITIAVIKALLIVSIFMHVGYGKRSIWVFAGAGFFWRAFLLVLAMTGDATRS
jgi:cytochrome c oxidase subunit 4